MKVASGIFGISTALLVMSLSSEIDFKDFVSSQYQKRKCLPRRLYIAVIASHLVWFYSLLLLFSHNVAFSRKNVFLRKNIFFGKIRSHNTVGNNTQQLNHSVWMVLNQLKNWGENARIARTLLARAHGWWRTFHLRFAQHFCIIHSKIFLFKSIVQSGLTICIMILWRFQQGGSEVWDLLFWVSAWITLERTQSALIRSKHLRQLGIGPVCNFAGNGCFKRSPKKASYWTTTGHNRHFYVNKSRISG